MDNKLETFQAKWPKMFANVYCGFHLPKGWTKLVWELCEQLSDQVTVVQVKQKFNSLRFYTDNATDHDLDLIGNCENQSSYVCLDCGTSPKTLTNGRCAYCKANWQRTDA